MEAISFRMEAPHRYRADEQAREVVGRYKGSVMGLIWSFFNLLLMLIIYTFVFSVVFKIRWKMDGST